MGCRASEASMGEADLEAAEDIGPLLHSRSFFFPLKNSTRCFFIVAQALT